MKVIKVGNTGFNADLLCKMTKKEAITTFSHLPKHQVENAWILANPKRKKTRKKSIDE